MPKLRESRRVCSGRWVVHYSCTDAQSTRPLLALSSQLISCSDRSIPYSSSITQRPFFLLPAYGYREQVLLMLSPHIKALLLLQALLSCASGKQVNVSHPVLTVNIGR